MSITRMIIREIRSGKLNFLLCLVTVAVACAAFVALLSISRGAAQATNRLLRDMGFNILIVPKGAEMARYWSLDFPDATMPEDYVEKLSKSDVTAEHFVAKLQTLTVVDGQKVVLTGVLPELGNVGRTRKKKAPMGYDVPQGEAYAGSGLVKSLKLAPGGSVTVMDKVFKVSKVLPETGTMEDIRLFAHLHDVQPLLGKEGMINAIDALGCRCYHGDDFMGQITSEVNGVLPDVQIQHYKSIAIARELTRRQFDAWAEAVMIAVLVLGACAIAALTYLNVRHRRHEIGLLRTVGVGTPRIAWLFLGKAVIYALLGASLGFALGYGAATVWGPGVAAGKIELDPMLLAYALAGAPLVAILFGAVPILHGLLLDPAFVLREE